MRLSGQVSANGEETMAMSRLVAARTALISGRVGGEARRALVYRGGLAAAMLLAALVPVASQTRNGPTSVAPVAEKLIDAVVNLSTSQNMKGPGRSPMRRVAQGAPLHELV